MVKCGSVDYPIPGFWQHLSSILHVRLAVEGQEFGPFVQVIRDNCDTVSSHILDQSKTSPVSSIAWRTVRSKSLLETKSQLGGRKVAS